MMAGFRRFLGAVGHPPVVDWGRVAGGVAVGGEVDVLYWLLEV